MKRIPQKEWLDEDIGTPEQVASSLLDLRAINRRFGGISTTAYLLRQAMQATKLTSASVLEVAAGDGYSAREAVKDLACESLRLEVTLLDRRQSHLPSENGVHTVVGDAFNLPFEDERFDFVSCGLFVHHFSPDEVVRFAKEALRVCRRALLINDLVRSYVHLGLVFLGLPLFRSPITRHDSIASVRQAYEVGEMEALLKRTGAKRIEIARHYLQRMAVTVWK